MVPKSPIDGRTRHAPPGSVVGSGKYPTVTGLEHDEAGHPSGSSAVHAKMNARRREKIKAVAQTLPPHEIYGDQEGDALVDDLNAGLAAIKADGTLDELVEKWLVVEVFRLVFVLFFFVVVFLFLFLAVLRLELQVETEFGQLSLE